MTSVDEKGPWVNTSRTEGTGGASLGLWSPVPVSRPPVVTVNETSGVGRPEREPIKVRPSCEQTVGPTLPSVVFSFHTDPSGPDKRGRGPTSPVSMEVGYLLPFDFSGLCLSTRSVEGPNPQSPTLPNAKSDDVSTQR